jgi:hypothetical protein
MKLKNNKHLNSLAVNLDIPDKTELVERTVLKLFKVPGIVKNNYSKDDILQCLSVLLDFYEVGIITNEAYRNELIDNVSNLEIVN